MGNEERAGWREEIVNSSTYASHNHDEYVQEVDCEITSANRPTKDTYFAFSSNAKYITKGKGVLTYLKVSPESLPNHSKFL